jgi:hypothetical protein
MSHVECKGRSEGKRPFGRNERIILKYIVTCYAMQKSCFHRAVPKRAEESRRELTKAEVSRANKREECLYFVAPQRLATHITRLAQQ